MSMVNIVAKKNGIGSLTLVDEQGRFTLEVDDMKGQYVKEEFYSEGGLKEFVSFLILSIIFSAECL